MQRAKDSPLFFLCRHTGSPFPRKSGSNSKRPVNYFHKVSLFAKNQPIGLRHGKIRACFRIGPEPRPVGLISRQAIERDQSPCHIICSFEGKKISHKFTAATRNNAPPILSIFLKLIALKWIDLVANNAGNLHNSPLLRQIPSRVWIDSRKCGDNRCMQHTGSNRSRNNIAASERTRNQPRRSHDESMPLSQHQHFVYRHIMDVILNARLDPKLRSANISHGNDVALSRLAAAIGEPSRARILCCLLDGHARTSTELAMVAEVSPSTASVHLNRLKAERLVKMLMQGKHRYYSLAGADVASALEALMVVAGGSRPQFTPTTPAPLRHARTCYDHMAGAVAVSLHSRFVKLGWILPASQRPASNPKDALELTSEGTKACEALGIDIAATLSLRRRFAYACLDWSERKPHIGGALGASILQTALQRKWVQRDLDSRVLNITRVGRRELSDRFGIDFEQAAATSILSTQTPAQNPV